MNFIFLGITKGETAGTWQQKTLRKSKKNQEKIKSQTKKIKKEQQQAKTNI